MTHSLRVAAALGVAVAAVAVYAVSASASAPHLIHAQTTITNAVFPDAYLTTACGFEVNDTLNAFTTATGVVAANGEVVSEFDTWSGTFTFTAPGSGKSVTRPLKALVFTQYGSGAVVGSTGVSTSVGPQGGTLSGGPPGTGAYTTNIEVVGFDEASGIPFASPTTPISAHGDFAFATRAICGALG